MSNNSRAFKAILWKEIRENLRWAMVGLIAVTTGMGGNMYALTRFIQEGYFEAAPPNAGIIEIFRITAMVLPLLGLVIGLAQSIPENHGDRWAFLTHRPVRRQTLFLGKAVAGIGFLTVATALPIAGFLAWIAVPQHLPIPFDIRMALPGVADLLCGIVYYFAGLLIGMRHARWYASRTLSIGVGVVCSIMTLIVGEFWLAAAINTLGVLIAGTAAWGAFVAGGRYETQPRLSRFATALATGTGLLIVAGIGSSVISASLAGPTPGERSSDYVLKTNGDIVQTHRGRNGVLDDPGMERAVLETFMTVRQPDPDPDYRGSFDFFVNLESEGADKGILWSYIPHKGLIAAYEIRSARRIGWLGPDGFTAQVDPPLHRFNHPLLRQHLPVQTMLVFTDAVYRLNEGQRKIEKIFSAEAGETVVGAAKIRTTDSVLKIYGSQPFETIATTKRIVVQTLDGTVQASMPQDPKAAGFRGMISVSIALRAPDTPTFVWYRPDDSKKPYQITKIGDGNVVLQHFTLPRVEQIQPVPWAGIFPGLAMPLPLRILMELELDTSGVMTTPQRIASWILPCLASLIAAIAAFRRGRKYAFAKGRLWLWTVLGFAVGPLALVLMWMLVEWPALEPCAACGRPRVVTREHCEHCSKSFMPPHSDGTEIFEPVIT